MMLLVILGVLLFAPVAGNYIYKHNGKKQVFNLDLVQFVYLFVLSPILFVWMKSFLFFILRSESSLSLSVGELFVIDTAFTLAAFFIFSAVAIHTLTKTFWLRKNRDPEFDLFHLSEYYHQWWSHIVIFVGAMVLVTFISLANVISPLTVMHSQWQLYLVITVGFLFGMVFFLSIWNADPKQRNFMKLMKLFVGLFFVLHVGVYFILDSLFRLSYGVYWFVFSMFIAMVISGLFFQRSKWINKFRKRLQHQGWGENILVKKEK